jgi:kumamolisin
MTVRTLSALSAFAAAVLFMCGATTIEAQAADSGAKRFERSIVPVPLSGPPGSRSAAVAPLSESERNAELRIHFGFPIKNIDELKARVAKGEIIPPEELAKRYSGDAESAKKLAAWLAEQGFKSIEITPDNTSVYATGTVAQIEKSLNVTMQSVTVHGETMAAATTAPTLPADVGDAVMAIDGLQPFVKAFKNSIGYRVGLGGVPAPSPGGVQVERAGHFRGYRVDDILEAYDADNLKAGGKRITGKGQTIAILIDTFPRMSDLQAFWRVSHLPVKKEQIHFIDVKGVGIDKLPKPSGEETLDVEWVSAIAPGADLRVYAAGSLSFVDLDRALDKIFLDQASLYGGIQQVSISLGLREDEVSPDELDVEAQKYLTLAAMGVTVFISSGDDGSNPPARPGGPPSPESHVQYGASDPSVVSVGGTSLYLRRGKVVEEAAWKGSGGGVCQRGIARPTWQRSFQGISSAQRLVPDISAVADPSTGGIVILNNQGWIYGGTSWATPLWAGFAALIAEAREVEGKPRLGFLSPALYALPKGFRDIVAGNNGAYQARPGWDPVTGLGVPDVRLLIQELDITEP